MSKYDQFEDARDAYDWCMRQALRDGWEVGTSGYRAFVDILFAEVWTNAE